MDALSDEMELKAAWMAFDRLANLRPLRSEADYDRTVALMNRILDAGGVESDDPLSGLLELVSDMVHGYEQLHYPAPEGEPHQVLAFLLEQGQLMPEQLSKLATVAELQSILAGERRIDARLARQLGEYFGVSAALFGGADCAGPKPMAAVRQRAISAT